MVVLVAVVQPDDTPLEDFLRFMNVGKARLDADNPAGAIDAFSEALTILPTNADARTNLAIALSLVFLENIRLHSSAHDL